MDFDPHYPIPSCERVAVVKYLERETKSMAASGYPDLHANARSRQMALYRILQNSSSENFDAFIPYLAMNYFDRFLSRQELLKIEVNWVDDVDLLAISCLSLAWKMRDSSFNLSAFLRDKNIKLKMNNITAAELRILIALDWRMRSITAFCFAHLLFDECRPPKGLRRKSLSQIIVETQDDIRFTVFKPSVISASALLAAFSYLYRGRYQIYENKFMDPGYINKIEVIRCTALMKEMCVKKQLWMETGEMDIMEGPRLRVQAGAQRSVAESSHSSEQTIGTRSIEGSSDAKRHGKAPVEEEIELEAEPKLEPVSEIQPAEEAQTMNFELKWVIDRELDSLLSRPPGHAGNDSSSFSLCFLPCQHSDSSCTAL